jgi:hypothetical protein
MTRHNLDALSDEELVTRFAEAAKQRGAAVLDSATRRANRIFRHMWSINNELRFRGKAARLKLIPLLDDKDRFVRYYAAKHLLSLVPDRARAEIERNAKYTYDAICGDAGMTLYNLDTGVFKPD